MNSNLALLTFQYNRKNFFLSRLMKRFVNIASLLLVAAVFFASPLALANCQDDCNSNAAIDDSAAGALYGVAIVACIGTGPAYPGCVAAASATLAIAVAAVELHREVCVNGCPKE